MNNKKGGVELSTTAIISMVIAMVILVIILAMVTKYSGSATNDINNLKDANFNDYDNDGIVDAKESPGFACAAGGPKIESNNAELGWKIKKKKYDEMTKGNKCQNVFTNQMITFDDIFDLEAIVRDTTKVPKLQDPSSLKKMVECLGIDNNNNQYNGKVVDFEEDVFQKGKLINDVYKNVEGADKGYLLATTYTKDACNKLLIESYEDDE